MPPRPQAAPSCGSRLPGRRTRPDDSPAGSRLGHVILEPGLAEVEVIPPNAQLFVRAGMQTGGIHSLYPARPSVSATSDGAFVLLFAEPIRSAAPASPERGVLRQRGNAQGQGEENGEQGFQHRGTRTPLGWEREFRIITRASCSAKKVDSGGRTVPDEDSIPDRRESSGLTRAGAEGGGHFFGGAGAANSSATRSKCSPKVGVLCRSRDFWIKSAVRACVLTNIARAQPRMIFLS